MKHHNRGRGGRPVDPRIGKRTHSVMVRMSDSEYQHLTAAAAAAGLTRSALIRRIAAGARIRTPPAPVPAVNRELWADLARVGSNLNQIARHINEGRAHGIDPALIEAVAEQLRLVRLALLGSEK